MRVPIALSSCVRPPVGAVSNRARIDVDRLRSRLKTVPTVLKAIVFGLACLSASPNALAHAILVKANPEREAVVAAAPEEVLLVFNDAVGEEFLALAVIDESGKRVDKHDAHLEFSDRSHLRASVEKLAPGRYIVRYRVLSADGHVVSGKYSFQLQPK